jgi:SOS-response transcriptional repressor LexA
MNIRFSDIPQAPCYPFSVDAVCEALWHIADMDEPAFDRDRILAAMKARKPKKITQTDMAKVMGLPSQSAFSNILKSKRKVTVEEAKKAYDYLGITSQPQIQWVPVIGIANAGRWREAIQMPLGSLPVRPGSVSDEAFAVEIAGDSMDRLIPDGGHIIVDPRQKELRDGKVYLIQNADHEVTVKAYFRTPPRFEPVSSNPDHKGWPVADHDFIVLGRVVKKVEDL